MHCKKKPYIIAIDGRTASGKSHLAARIQTAFGGDIIHMDDFFLPADLRTPERYQIPGGNIHYERFIEEVLPHLAKPEPFSYRIFNCHQMNYTASRKIWDCNLRIVEGSYSCHPVFGAYADLTIFTTVDPEEQLRRIGERNGTEMALVFQDKWIPLEEAYFSHCQTAEHADLILSLH